MNQDALNQEDRLSSDSAEVRRRAALELADDIHPESINLLMQALGDEEWRVRKAAVSAASSMHRQGTPGLVARLVDEMVQEERVGLRNAACESLTTIGKDALPDVIERMPALPEGGRKIAIEVLGAVKDPRAVTELVKRLEDPDWNVRACAAEWLGEQGGEQAAEALLRCLESEDRLIVLCALQSLNQMGVKIPWPLLGPLSDQPLFGTELLLALGRCGQPEAASIIFASIGSDAEAATAMTLLHRSSTEAATAVEAALANIDDDAIAFLLECITKGEPGEQRAAASCLLWSRPLAQMDIIVGLSSQESLYSLLVDELKRWGPPVISRLEEMVSDSEGRTRASVIGLLTRIMDVESGQTKMDLFISLLESEDIPIATAAASAVGRFGGAAGIEKLISLTDSTYERVRRSAGQALVELGRKYPAEVRAAFGDKEFEGSSGLELCRVLEVVGTPDNAPLLSVMLASPTPRLRAASIRSLAAIKGSDAVDTIALAMTDEDLGVQMAAAASLGRIGPAASETIVSALGIADGPLKAALIRTLGQVGHPEAKRILRAMCKDTADVALASLTAIHSLGVEAEEIEDDILGHPDSEVVKQALQLFGTKMTTERLRRLLGHAMWDVRLAAVEGLASPPEEIQKILSDHLRDETDYLVTGAIKRVLEKKP